MRVGDFPVEIRRLIESLTRHPDFTYRNEAAEKLGETGDRRCVPFLIQALEDPNVNVVHSAMYSLMELGDAACVESVSDVLRDESRDRMLRIAAADVLGEFPVPAAIDALTAIVFEEMSACGVEELQSLLEQGTANEPGASVGTHCLDSLRRIGTQALTNRISQAIGRKAADKLREVIYAIDQGRRSRGD